MKRDWGDEVNASHVGWRGSRASVSGDMVRGESSEPWHWARGGLGASPRIHTRESRGVSGGASNGALCIIGLHGLNRAKRCQA